MFTPTSKENPFVIMLPPPNITGSLHMGHALQDTIMDILSRYHRMLGESVLWLPGTDHAALPTNKIINDQLAAEGTDRFKIGREKFLERTQEWYDKTGKEIVNQMKRMGCSCDWSRERFTMDDKYVAAVNAAFINYFEKGYIYRGARIVNWDPQTQTTVSDLEIDWKTEKVPFYTFKYGPFEISTARPETKFGDKYVVMHPDDERYQQYKHGDQFEAQWINGKITATVIKDEAIDREFGTGVMTITPWHDVTDFAIAVRHGLDMEPIIDLDGKLLPIAGEFAGMPITEARPKIAEKLRQKGLLAGVEENYEHNVALNDRGKGVIEPQVMRQWFVDMKKLKAETLEAAQKDLIRFIPVRWKKHFIDWMENVYDWNINRQIWLGHRLPVWWKKGTHGTADEDGNFVVSVDPPAEGEWEQDPDVLDTWFSSALWPIATLGWPEATDDLNTFYPTSVLVTARDILYLWVARMVFSGLELMQGEKYGNRKQAARIPFKDVFIHPTVLAKDGRRMSKSLGTGVDPLGLIEQYGADATRFGLIYQMSFDSQAIKFDEQAIKAARNFTNKIWNIARFLSTLEDRGEKSLADDWIESRLAKTAQQVTGLINEYKFGEAARLLYEFVWKDFADWYVEMLKVEGSATAARESFATILRLLHPFMPFVTEKLWEQYGEDNSMLISSSWPALDSRQNDFSEIDYIKDIVSTVRGARTLLGVKPGSAVDIYMPQATAMPLVVQALCRASIANAESGAMRRFPLMSGGYVAIGSAEITDQSLSNARDKLNKERTKLEAFIQRQEATIAGMAGKAPADKIAEKKTALEEAEQRLKEIFASLQLLT